MIEYFKGAYGVNLLLRWHGSALAKAFIPGLIAVGVYLGLSIPARRNGYEFGEGEDYLNHPYAIGVLVSSVSFLIVFRANYGYQRYWEACGNVHHCMSKWMDATIHTSVFHLQCHHYDTIKPPSYFDNDELNLLNLTRDRERGHEEGEVPSGVSDRSDVPQSCRSSSSSTNVRQRRYKKSINQTTSTRAIMSWESDEVEAAEPPPDGSSRQLLGPGRMDGGWGLLYPKQIHGKTTATWYDIDKLGSSAKRIPPTAGDSYYPDNDQCGFAGTAGGRTPPLFLQELAHLSSLCCAVALSTLRNDLDDAESPLDVYKPGEPWPAADPGKLPQEVLAEAYPYGLFFRNVRYLLGVENSRSARTRYNAVRPLLVIGGVSDNEIAFLQRAKGPLAKTQLAWQWLTEFIMREHLAGSTGDVAPPIVSRIVQFLSDGMIYYNHARKIMFVPFPFPHAQLSAFFVMVMLLAVPLLMHQYTNETWLGAILTFLTVTCLAGLHEVARELENPFRNAPNDIPLCTLQAFYNEALLTMFAGYHPDHFWDPDRFLRPNGVDVVVEEGESEDNDDSTEGGADAAGGDAGQEGDAPVMKASEETAPTASEEEVSMTTGSLLSASPGQDGQDQGSVESESLRELRLMVERQSKKIEELRDRMQSRDVERLGGETNGIELVAR